MRIFQTLVPIASLALVVSGEIQKPTAGSKDVKFEQGGVEKVLDVNANGLEGDVQGAMKYAKKFFDDNPGVLKSILKVLDDPKHMKAKTEIYQDGFKLHQQAMSNPDEQVVYVDAVNYFYSHPEILSLVGAIGKQVAKDHPTLIENGFVSLEKIAAKNPEVFKKIRAKAVDFANNNEVAFEKTIEMVLKSAIQDVKSSAKISKKLLKLDQIICSGGSTDCNCEPDATYGLPDKKFDPVVPEIEETSEPKPEVDAPEVDPEVPEIQETSEPEPEEVGYARPDVKGEVPEVTDPVKPEATYGKPDVAVDYPEVTEPLDPEPESTYGKPEVTDPKPPITYSRPSGSPKTIMDPK